MGVRGLSTYINNKSHLYLKNYNLHDTYLIIDGDNITFAIYEFYVECNSIFGGDYDSYSDCVSNFFDNLLKCNVTPLIIFDGVTESKKLKLVINRYTERMKVALQIDIYNQKDIKYFPLFLSHIFMYIIKEKNIHYIRDLMEADGSIASLALALNCPVLSSDSDFYIYDITYIPFKTLYMNITKSSTGYTYIKCKIYKQQYLVQYFKGLHKSIIPLFATLMGNDYIQSDVFEDFFRQQELTRISRAQRIERILNWLCYYNLNTAITSILNRLAISIQQKVLDLIVTNINHYTNLSTRILRAFDFSEDYIAQMSTYYLKKRFEYSGSIKILTHIECTNKQRDDINVINNLPQWFLKKYQTAMIPSYFMNLIIHQLYIPYVQLEDYSCTPAIECSLQLTRFIFTFLKSAINGEVKYMRYLTRNMLTNCTRTVKLKCVDAIKYGPNTEDIYEFTHFVDFDEISLSLRLTIFNYITHITDDSSINELPQEWLLYVICIKYWIQETKTLVSHNCYLYSLIICMLYNIIDSKIGKYKNMNTFLNKYQKIIETIPKDRKNEPCNVMIDNTIIVKNYDIDYSDCLQAAPFFISNFKMNQKLLTNPKKFNKQIVHRFSEFQFCVLHIINLNKLLGYPYQEIKIDDFYHGTLLYNLCSNFKTRSNIDEYINIIFRTSPSFLKLFNTLLLKIT